MRKENWKLMRHIIQEPDSYFESTNIDYFNKYKYREYTVNHNLANVGAKKMIGDAEEIIIYGAGMYGQRLLERFSDKSKIIGFAVTDLEDDTPKEIKGIPVFDIKDLRKDHVKAIVIVAMKKSTQLSVLELLKNYGFNSVISVDHL